MRITVDASSLGATALRLNRLAARLDDLREPLDAIGGILESSAIRRIAEKKTAPDGSPWQALKPETVRQKRSARILVRYGNLLATITRQTTGNSVTVGSPMLYAPFLQQGTRHMAARPFLGISSADHRDINELLADWLAQGLDDAATG